MNKGKSNGDGDTKRKPTTQGYEGKDNERMAWRCIIKIVGYLGYMEYYVIEFEIYKVDNKFCKVNSNLHHTIVKQTSCRCCLHSWWHLEEGMYVYKRR